MTGDSEMLNEMVKWSREYTRPWKLLSLIAGLAFLIFDSIYSKIMDWDIPISVIMGIVTYITAPWSLRVIVERRWKCFPIMLFAVWFSIDGCYCLYWYYTDPFVLKMMRSYINFFTCLFLYVTCALIWYYQGSLQELVKDVRSMFHHVH